MTFNIPLFKHHYDEASVVNSLSYMRHGQCGYGLAVQSFEMVFKKVSGKTHNVGTNSASMAAFITFAYLKDTYGICDVYTPSLTFTSPVWAAKHHGHNIYFVDVEKETAIMSFSSYKTLRVDSDNKVVVMPMLFGGNSELDMNQLLGDEFIVIDSAHSVQHNLKSDITFFSFHYQKPIPMSQGGMFSTNHQTIASYAKKYRNFGRENIGGSYIIDHPGFKGYLDNINASLAHSYVGSSQYIEDIQTRKINFLYIQSALKDTYTFLTHDEQSSFYIAVLRTHQREKLREKLANAGIQTDIHYPPLHKSEFYKSSKNIELLNTDALSDTMLSIPIHHNLTFNDCIHIIETLRK